jgi:hypothetical protein
LNMCGDGQVSLNKSYRTEVPNLHRKSCKRFGNGSESSHHYPRHSTHRPMGKRNELTKNWNSTSAYSVITKQTTGHSYSRSWNSPTTHDPIVLQGNPHSRSGTDTDQSSSLPQSSPRQSPQSKNDCVHWIRYDLK